MNEAQTEINIPHLFRCPISLDLLEDPVTLTTGQTYDRSSIEKWISAVSQTEDLCHVLGNSQKLVHEIVQVVMNQNSVDNDEVSTAAIKALSALSSLESNKESLVKCGAINGIITYISRCENGKKINLAPLAMATLKKLLVLESGKEALVNHVNGIETLVKMVFKVCNQECSESAVGILSIICSDFGSAREVAIGAGVLSQLLFLLQSQCGTKTKTKARMLLKLLRSKWSEESMQV
ncbi:U-box domain-containing protein 25-like [Trifolium pratense]|uniref:U-box domain-containing protein n=1 Tax=Trifolium pratense TaxID=57577 RepID=A0A2K3NGW0_TRIPR|nr:U-box domain-containing protein 25-like [Trifolium pratense]PNY02249.1 U-box domain-containing protein 25-like [Trifolium pratense]